MTYTKQSIMMNIMTPFTPRSMTNSHNLTLYLPKQDYLLTSSRTQATYTHSTHTLNIHGT